MGRAEKGNAILKIAGGGGSKLFTYGKIFLATAAIT